MLRTVPLKVGQLRRLATTAAFPPPSSLPGAFEERPFVQADPIRAPARAQDLILRHRVRGYKAGHLERAYPELGLDEVHLHAYGFGTPAVRSLLLPRFSPASPSGRHMPAGLEADVLAFVRGRDETHPRDLEAAFGRATAANPWGGLSKATTRALDALHHHGHLRVVRREQGIRVYSPAAPPAENLSPSERLVQISCVVVDLLGPVRATTLSSVLSAIARSILDPVHVPAAKTAVTRSDLFVALEVDGVRYVARAPYVVLGQGMPHRVRFLAPFDPLVWDRRRFEHFWGWAYRFEAYVPPSKRKLGYYAMPLMWGEDIVGWVNVRTLSGTTDIEAGYVSEPKNGTTFQREFDREVARLAAFLG